MTQAAGRPRAADADDKLTAAALDLYGRNGWEGLSIAAAAQHAGVGKSSAYLRWQAKADLLAAALERHGAHVEDVDTGSIRSDLIALGMAIHALFDGPAGAANLRLLVEARQVPALGTIRAKALDAQTAAARRVVQRGIERGQLPPSTSIGLVLNAVVGGVTNQVLTTPTGAPPTATRLQTLRFCERLVDLVLTGLPTTEAADPSH